MLSFLQKYVHRRCALNRRIKVLADEISRLLPEHGSVLDVGTGSGEIARQILLRRPELTLQAIDTHVRNDCEVPVQQYDGKRIPLTDQSVDFVLLIDVLHHTEDPVGLMHEAFRVARYGVIIKDHICESQFARKVMTMTDWFANRQHGVSLPYNFFTRAQWQAAWKKLNVRPQLYCDSFGLYPWYSYLIFARDMDFIAHLPATQPADSCAVAL